MLHTRRSDVVDEHLQRMAEPGYLKSLRSQAEALEAARKERQQEELNQIEAQRLREQIIRMGGKPVA